MLRATMDGNRLIGKVNPRHRVCYLPHNGKEVMIVKMMMVISLSQNMDFSKYCLTLLTRHVNW